MDVNIAVSKIKKYATSSSGDTVEVVERPNGGLSVVMADGQSSGRGAKWISTLVVRKVITLLAEGVRDGAAARAASDSLFTERGGKVSSTLNIISIDRQTQTIVLTRNNSAPTIFIIDGEIQKLDEPCQSVGLYRDTRPVITQKPLQPGLYAIIFSDGLIHAGKRYGTSMDIESNLEIILDNPNISAQFIADSLLKNAMDLDQNRPSDDISVVVVSVQKHSGDLVRRMSVSLPLGP